LRKTLGEVLYVLQSKTPTEKEWVALVRSIAEGDQIALHALYERSHRIVFTLIMQIVSNRETAEELTLDVYHDVWRRASRYDAASGTALGWIMNQARSRAIDRLRLDQRKRRGDLLPDSGLLAIDAPEYQDLLQAKEQRQALLRALGVLGAGERAALEAAFFGEKTCAEVAARLNEPPETITTGIRRALHKLRQALADDGRGL
jgi:RNA polymerase sigma-70 factor (ECF subfamily)